MPEPPLRVRRWQLAPGGPNASNGLPGVIPEGAAVGLGVERHSQGRHAGVDDVFRVNRLASLDSLVEDHVHQDHVGPQRKKHTFAALDSLLVCRINLSNGKTG
jgi:hypothetical protein